VETTSVEFWRLVEEATRADDELLDTRLIEPHLIRVLKFVESRPAERALFVQHFVALATAQRHATPYLVPFCMRTLRYPEVLSAVDAAIAAGRDAFRDCRKWPWLSDVRNAYSEPWRDAALFPFYESSSKKA
jgi:hypothetical protein